MAARPANGVTEENFQTMPELAYKIISRKILDGEFQPGMRLSRRKMAEVTGVSVIPVIEALKRLEDDKLVESRPQWGSFVTVPTLEKVIETYQFREAIECQVARMVAVSLTPEQKEELGEIAQILDNTPYSPETTEQMRDMHFKFHTKLASYTGNLLLQEALRKINLFWILCKALRETRSRFAAPRYWHQRLLDVIAQGDPEEADKMMRLHIMDSLDPIVENWGKEE